jgi:hypothetical protein
MDLLPSPYFAAISRFARRPWDELFTASQWAGAPRPATCMRATMSAARDVLHDGNVVLMQL